MVEFALQIGQLVVPSHCAKFVDSRDTSKLLREMLREHFWANNLRAGHTVDAIQTLRVNIMTSTV